MGEAVDGFYRGVELVIRQVGSRWLVELDGMLLKEHAASKEAWEFARSLVSQQRAFLSCEKVAADA